jgi:IS30 family transposase
MTYAHSSSVQIEERRRKVASYLARAMTETEIARQLNVDQSTISRDIKALKENSNQFIYDLAKSDLAYYYTQKLNSLEQAKKEAWTVYNNTNDETINTYKVKLLALKMIIAADEASIKLLNEGPAILAMKSLEERLTNVETV